MTTETVRRRRAVGDGFELEHAGGFTRISCGACDKHDLVPADDQATVDKWKTAHRHGARTSAWDRGDL